MKKALVLTIAASLISMTAQASVLATCTGSSAGLGMVKSVKVEVINKKYVITEENGYGSTKVYEVAKKSNSQTVTHKLELVKNNDGSSKSLNLEISSSGIKGAMLYDSGNGEFTNLEFLNCK